jgi:hypothetical protein
MKPKIPSTIEYVHLQWDGPRSWEEKTKLKSAEDYGIYQIYGCHPVHGADWRVGDSWPRTFSNLVDSIAREPAHPSLFRPRRNLRGCRSPSFPRRVREVTFRLPNSQLWTLNSRFSARISVLEWPARRTRPKTVLAASLKRALRFASMVVAQSCPPSRRGSNVL